MRSDSIELEERRLAEVSGIADYPAVHERHRLFPRILQERGIRRVLDISAGIGLVGSRIRDLSDINVVCNDVSPKCIAALKHAGLNTLSFDLDADNQPYPIPDETFDAVVCLATIEHLINTEHFINEVRRILTDEGRLYLSAPNYSGLTYLLPFLVTGRTFHDPMSPGDRYEFFAHVRYFTYRTMIELVESCGFCAETAYLAAPKESSKFLALKSRSGFKAMAARFGLALIYALGSPRWAAEPVVCFRKHAGRRQMKIKKRVVM